MIKGIGIDIIELSRVQELMGRQQKFVDRVLTENEKRRFEKLTSVRRTEFLAGRFAAKEAYAKAVGTGIGKELSFLDIEIDTDEFGKPFVSGPYEHAHVSISHSRDYCVAQVIIEEL
ncbi:holo-ACP synthase [Neobacillus mesonae]|uniref:Holo-[acyl-carrier-protein] synthase n=1 Tax=Neobacillus mesonae TaxID=1193713 RepID=A0A3Q9QQV2_9BACI|nr:holo-ACP synthase [Neobacillus mesonae]AZU60076.1 holo-ACP synthase [Neobacillus mesonae]